MEAEKGLNRLSPDPRRERSPADGRDGRRIFSEGCRREDEADRSLRVILASTTRSFNPELLPLSNPTRGVFLSSPPRMSATGPTAARSAGDERSASYVGNIDDTAGPDTPVVRSISMAAGLEAAAYSQRARIGVVRKRFIPPLKGSSSSVLEARSRSAVMDGDGGGSSVGVGGPGGIVSPDLGRPPSQASCRSRANADSNADVSPRWRDRISGGRVFGSGSVARSGSESGATAPAAEAEPPSGVIVDVIVVHGSDAVPDCYCKLVRSAGGKRADLNSGSMGQHVFLAVKRDPGESLAGPDGGLRSLGVPGGGGGILGGRAVGVTAVVALALIFPDRGETVPPLFQKVRRRGQPVDLNHGTNGERSFLCYKRGTTNPITDIQVYFPRKREAPPHGYNRLETSPGGHPADLNSGSGGAPIFLAYKQEPVCLRALRSGVSFSSSGSEGSWRADEGVYGLGEGGLLGKSSGINGLRFVSPRGLYSLEVEDGDKDNGDDDEVNNNDDHGDHDEDHDTNVDDIEADDGTAVVDGEGRPVPYRLRDTVFLLLAGVYVRHGTTSASCMREVTRLLTETPFFLEDMKVGVGAGLGGVTGRDIGGRTLLDFAVVAMSDSLDQVVEERFPLALSFFQALVKTSEGRLGPLALQRTFLGLSFLCSYACSSRGWVQACGGKRGPLKDSDPSLCTLKELLRLVCRQVEIAEETRAALQQAWAEGNGGIGEEIAEPTPATMAIPTWDTYTPMVHVEGCEGEASWARTPDAGSGADMMYPQPASSPLSADVVHAFVSNLVGEVVSSAVDMVELAKIMETVLDVVKRHSSHSSETFWRDVGDFGTMLFGERKQAHVSAFVMLAALCKMATGMLRTQSDGELVARDLGNKILALEMIHSMLRTTGEYFRLSRIFGYQVRRLVSSVVLANASDALLDGRCFRRTLMVVSELWRGFRTHCKVELAVLLEGFLLKTLRATSPQLPSMWRVIVLEELIKWFDAPNSLVELFLNYDMDRKFIQQWKIFEQTCSAFCAIAEGREEEIDVRADSEAERALGKLRLTALRSLSQIMKRLMDAAGHGHVMSTDKKTREMSLTRAGGWEAPEGFDAVGGGGGRGAENTSAPADIAAGGGANSNATPGADDAYMHPEESRILLEQPGIITGSSEALVQPEDGSISSPGGSIASATASGTRAESVRSSAGGGDGSVEGPHRRIREPNSFKYCKELRNRAEGVVTQALKLYATKGLKKAVQYLVASNFISDTPRDIANFLRIYNKDLDPQSIGEFLSEPDVNDGDYWKAIRLQYVRAISFHGKSLEEALRHLLTDSGFRLPGESQKVDRLLSSFAECYIADNRDISSCPFKNADTPFILSFAIIMLNTDLHRANAGTGKRRRRRMTKDDFINNLRGVMESGDAGQTLSRSYLGNIYDTIEARPIEMLLETDGESKGAGSKEPDLIDPCAFARQLSKAALGGEELLRALAMFGHRFSVVGVDTNLSLDLVKLMFQSVSIMMHGVVKSVLDRPQPDVDSVLASLDIVRYALGCSIFLEMPMEKAVFAKQLPKFWILTNRQEERLAQALSAAAVPPSPTRGGAAAAATTVGRPSSSLKSLSTNSSSTNSNPLNAPITGTLTSPSAASGDGSIGIASSTSFGSDTVRVGGGSGGSGGIGDGLLGSARGAMAAADGDAWLNGVENVENAVEAESTLAQVHSLVRSLEQRVSEAYTMEELHAVVRRIRNHKGLFDGTPRRFLREGDLIKYTHTGAKKTYRFFLFSDQLVYAHHLFSGDWKMHGQLLLALVKVVDLKDKEDCKFVIQHPKKSFTVNAKTVWNKKAWMAAISSASEAVLRARLEGSKPSPAAALWTGSSSNNPTPSRLGAVGGGSESRIASVSSSVWEPGSRAVIGGTDYMGRGDYDGRGLRSVAAAAAASAAATAARVGRESAAVAAAAAAAARSSSTRPSREPLSKLTVDTEAANQEAKEERGRSYVSTPGGKSGGVVKGYDFHRRDGGGGSGGGGGGRFLFSASSSKRRVIEGASRLAGDLATSSTIAVASASASSSASANDGGTRKEFASGGGDSAAGAAGAVGGGGVAAESSAGPRITTTSPANSTGAGSIVAATTSRDLTITAQPQGGGSRQQQPQAAGTPRSAGLMNIRSLLSKRWNPNIVGTPVSATVAATAALTILSPSRSAHGRRAPAGSPVESAARTSASSSSSGSTGGMAAAGGAACPNGGRRAAGKKARDPPEPSAAPPPAPATFWGEKTTARRDRRVDGASGGGGSGAKSKTEPAQMGSESRGSDLGEGAGAAHMVRHSTVSDATAATRGPLEQGSMLQDGVPVHAHDALSSSISVFVSAISVGSNPKDGDSGGGVRGQSAAAAGSSGGFGGNESTDPSPEKMAALITTPASAAAVSAAAAAASAVAAASAAASAAVSAAASAASADNSRSDSDLLDKALIAPPSKGAMRPGSGRWPGLIASESGESAKEAVSGRGHGDTRPKGASGSAAGGSRGSNTLLASSGSWSEAPDDQALTKKFRVSLMFYTKELMANAKQYGEGDKLALYGLFKQAKWGDCPAGLISAQRDDPVGSVKVRAWVTNRGKPTSQAMQEFIAVLGRVAPGWES